MAITVQKVLVKVFGSRNDRLLKRYRRIVEEVNKLEGKVQQMSDEQLRARTLELHTGLTAGDDPDDKPTLRPADVMPEALAIAREAMDRNIGIRQIFNPDESEFGSAKFDPNKLDDPGRKAFFDVQKRLIASGEPWQKVPIPVELYTAVRNAYPESRPPFRARPFDVQLIGGLVLYEGKIAEMATGEGKTFVAPLACFMRVLEGYHCHVVTVNDYLVRRDAMWIRPAFEALGLSVGYIQSDMEPGGDTRKLEYQRDVTYGTNSEFGFDYLRDNMKERADLQVQGSLDFAIVDEVDSILIDEARTPLIISGAAHDDAPKYRAADAVARKVIELNKPWDTVERAVDAAKRAIKSAEGDMDKAGKDKGAYESARKRRDQAEQQLAEAEAKKEGVTQYYEVEADRKSVKLTHEGWAAAQDAAGVGSFFVGSNVEWPHLMEQSMRAHVVYEKDKDYVIERGKGPRSTGELEVIIVDEYTGRKMEGRQWSDGLHQAVEAKEKVPIKQETQTLATITLQNFFKLYKALAGMTGTAQTEAEEFTKIYRLEVVSIPTNRPVIRQDNEDRVYRKEREKWDSIIEEIKMYSDAGRPVLVGTTSVEKSEELSNMLKRKYGVQHEVLNAKHHEREAHIVALAGQQHVNVHGELVGNVTIATNMAGRGTDIKPARETFFDVTGTPENGGAGKYLLKQRGTDKTVEVDPSDEESPLPQVFQLTDDEVKTVGGLHVIGTERHTARRIDNQLRGRSGRQGDPGSSRFYVSLEDELMKMFAGEWTIKVLGWLGMEEGMAIEDKRITKGIVRAQKKVEERNYLARKNLLEYDEVMDYQRTTFYGMRQQVLEGREVDKVIWQMIGESIQDAVDKYITQDFIAATVSEWARTNFEVSIDAEDLRGRRDIEDLEDYIKSQARNQVLEDLQSTFGEYLGEDPDERGSWDMRGLSSWAMSRYHVNLSISQIKKMDVEELRETLREAAIEQIDKRDVAGLEKYLEPMFAEKELSAWAKDKFQIDVAPEEMLEKTGRTQDRKTAGEIVELIESRAREAYARREVEYPVDHLLSFVYGDGQTTVENPYAADYVRSWARAKYGVAAGTDLTPERIRELGVRRLRDELIGLQEKFLHDGQLDRDVDAIVQGDPKPQEVADRFRERFGVPLDPAELHGGVVKHSALPGPNGDSVNGRADDDGDDGSAAADPRHAVLARARQILRQELTDLEQFILIQIFDQSWKDHLFAMDMLKSGIGLQAFAERDPRVLYKKEGFEYFQQMMAGIRDKVTDLIFRARIVGRAEARSAYKETAAVHEEVDSYGVAENLAATQGVDKGATVAGDEAGPEGQGGGGGGVETAVKVKTIVNEAPRVGRNDPCPCGSGKKYKKCCGVNAA
jgi:preprotein translocase subunit SecA